MAYTFEDVKTAADARNGGELTMIGNALIRSASTFEDFWLGCEAMKLALKLAGDDERGVLYFILTKKMTGKSTSARLSTVIEMLEESADPIDHLAAKQASRFVEDDD